MEERIGSPEVADFVKGALEYTTKQSLNSGAEEAQGQAPNVPSEQPEQPRSAPVGAFAAAAARVDLTRDLGSDASLPLPRVKRVLAAPSLQACDPHLCGVNNEGAFVIGKAAELFVSALAAEVGATMGEADAELSYDALAAAVERLQPATEFLLDFVPPRVGYSGGGAAAPLAAAGAQAKQEVASDARQAATEAAPAAAMES